MQGISVYEKNTKKSYPIYHTFNDKNGSYLEREDDKKKFLVLSQVDDCDPSSFYTFESLNDLIHDLDLVISEADSVNDAEMSSHLKEILVLCRFCLWNLEKYVLVMSPFECLSPSSFPESLPDKFRYNISKAGI